MNLNDAPNARPGYGVQRDDDDRARIAELARALNELYSQYDTLVELTNYIPLVRFTRLLVLIAKITTALSDVPLVVWEALFAYLRCDDERLADLTKEQLKKLVEGLLGLAELEKEAAEAGTGENPRITPGELEPWIERLQELLNQFDDFTQQQAVEAIAAAKEFINETFERVIPWYLDLFGEELRDTILRAGGVSAALFAIKAALKTIIYRILAKRLGVEAAKRLMPLVGVVISLVEFFAFLAILARLESIREAIDHILAELLNRLIDEGYYGWPTNFTYVWFKDPDCRGARVVITPYVQCFRRQGDKLVRDEESCRLEFTFDPEITAHLTEDSEFFKRDKGQWEIPFRLDEDVVNSAPCVEGAVLCFVYLRIRKVLGDQVTTLNLLVGARRV